MTTLTLTAHRAEMLTANERLHPMVRHRRTLILRQKACMTARANDVPAMSKAHIVVHITYPDRRRRDVHNVMPTVKAFVDGLVDAGMLPDDDDRHLIGPDLRVTTDRVDYPGLHWFRFEIREVAA